MTDLRWNQWHCRECRLPLRKLRKGMCQACYCRYKKRQRDDEETCRRLEAALPESERGA